MKLKTLKWFERRQGKTVFRDKTSCGCIHCDRVVNFGIAIRDKDHAKYLFNVQNEYANEGTYLNYRDVK